MKWVDIENEKIFSLKEGTICRTEDGRFIIVGEINTSFGTNDEFTEDVTHYTEDFVDVIREVINTCRKNYESRKR